ncbi:MAG: DUF5668 domain-containing protein [Firmicutes bacterium]|nr:DUF5668 domain-containing protein [Bacillota bacterium]
MTEEERGEEQKKQEARKRGMRGSIIVGLVLVIIGVIFLLNNFYPNLGFARLWPVLIIFWGLAVFINGFFPPISTSRLLSGIFIGTIGVILLYNTLGIVPYTFWINIINLWPVLLIAAGLAILASVVRSRILAALPQLLIILTLIFALIYQGTIFRGADGSGFKFSRDIPSGITKGTATVDFPVGELNLGATDKLYDIDAREFATKRRPQLSFTKSGPTVELRIAPNPITSRFVVGSRARRWRVLLSRDLEWTLDVDNSVSTCWLDLSDLKVTKLSLKSGVGNSTVRFGDKVDEANADIDAGVSGIRLEMPKSAGIRVRTNGGLSSTRFENIDLRRVNTTGNAVYETPNFDSAARKIIIDINLGISSFIVRGY